MVKIELKNHKKNKLKLESIIDKTTNAREMELESFFLSLALIFNDIKGLCMLERDFVEKYREPINGEATEHAGEWYGIKNQLFKNFVGILNEVLDLIQSKKELIEGATFQRYCRELKSNDKNIWFLLLNISGIKKSVDYSKEDIKSFKNLLMMVRNKNTFHYDKSGIDLLNGFRGYFYYDSEKPGKDSAMYSAAKMDFWGTRYYYADAALLGFMNNEFSKVDKSTQLITDEIYMSIMRVAKVIMGLLEVYHKEKRMV